MNPFSFPFIHQGYKLIKINKDGFFHWYLIQKIFTYLHVSWKSYTHKKSNIWGKKKYFQFFYSPSILYRLIKCPFPKKFARFFRRAKAIKPEAGANASAKRVRRAIKGYVWGGMPKSNGTWTGRCFFCVFPVALVWRFSLTSRLPSLSCKNAKKITPVIQVTNWLKAGPKRRIWSKGGVFFY